MQPPVETVAGRYRLTSLIGKGGMGSVWRAEHTSLLTPVAIKLLDPKLTEKPSVRARFLREAQAAASLRSKHVVQIFDHGVEDGFPYIVMELLRGESLASHLAAHRVLKPRAVGRIIAEVGRAMARAHKAGIIHRDLKPDNVFLAEPEEETAGEAAVASSVVKVVDFGIAKITDDAAFADDLSTDTGAMIGTPHYMSPEQARGLRTIDSRTDLWSMAVITYECLLGQRPFRADALGELVLKICTDPPPVPSEIGPVPVGFDAWFAKAINRNIDQRFQTVTELVYALEETLTPGIHHFEVAGGRTSVPTPTPSDGGELDSTVLAPGDDSAPGRAPSQAVSQVSSRTEDPATKSVAPTTERKSRGLLLAGGLLAAVGVAGAIALGSKSSVEERATPTAPAPTAAERAPAQSSSAALATPVSVAVSASAAPAAKEILLTVTSTPAGAAVFRGGERIGKAGEAIRIPWTSEAFEVSLRKDGYKSKTLAVTPAASVELKATLELKPSSKETPF